MSENTVQTHLIKTDQPPQPETVARASCGVEVRIRETTNWVETEGGLCEECMKVFDRSFNAALASGATPAQVFCVIGSVVATAAA